MIIFKFLEFKIDHNRIIIYKSIFIQFNKIQKNKKTMLKELTVIFKLKF